WGRDVRGPYAVEQSMSRQPMKPGEVRTLKMFVPDVNKICDVKVTAREAVEVQLGGGVKRTLLRVDPTSSIDGKPPPEFDQTMWVDSSGQVLKAKSDVLGGLVWFRTTREGALTPDVAGGSFDQILHSVIKVARKIPRPEETRNVRYRVALNDGDVTEVIPADRRQSLSPGSKKGEGLLTVTTAGPYDGRPGEDQVDPAYTRPNAMVTSADDRVVELARRAVGGATDPWEKAKRVTHWVHKNLKDKNFATGFAAASEVARNLTGDCTEHGV